jgi:hypothetical protein
MITSIFNDRMDTASTEMFPQIVIALVITAAIFFIYLVIEQLWRAYLNYGAARIDVYPYTGASSKTIVIQQDPRNPSSKTLALSENQLTGIEFSYSTFLYISDENDDNTMGWKSVFYKGYESGPFPLCGPGVFVSTTSSTSGGPTLRVVMNTYDTWFNTIDVNQIPFNKWIHLALVLRNNTMEVYVNGNIAAKKTFNGTLPYQNYQPLVLFPSATTPATEFDSTTTSKHGMPVGENFLIRGKFSGYISNLSYYTYAISYSEIQRALTVGPSSKFEENSMDKPPYLIDSWWTSRAK